MGIALDLSSRAGGTLAGAKELARGLMRGDRAELKLGYSAANAAIAVAEAFARDGVSLTTDQQEKLLAYCVAFGRGMKDEPKDAPDGVVITATGIRLEVATDYDEGFYDGQGTDVTKVYPAGGGL